MFHRLPREIIQLIYEYDNTYHEIYKKVIEEIHPFKIYKVLQTYYIYDPKKSVLYYTNSVERPHWICSIFYFSNDQMEALVESQNLKRLHICLEYDIENYQFGPNEQQQF